MEEELPHPENTYPISYKYLDYVQRKSQSTQDLASRKGFGKKTFRHGRHSYELVHKEDRIVIPTKKLQKRVVQWFHDTLRHPGETRTELTIAQHFYWPKLKDTVKEVCSRCDSCKLQKHDAKKYGKLPAKIDVEDTPWKKLCIDLVGPYKLVNLIPNTRTTSIGSSYGALL